MILNLKLLYSIICNLEPINVRCVETIFLVHVFFLLKAYHSTTVTIKYSTIITTSYFRIALEISVFVDSFFSFIISTITLGMIFF